MNANGVIIGNKKFKKRSNFKDEKMVWL
jgi:hypothetical protein